MKWALEFLAGLEGIAELLDTREWASHCALRHGAEGLCFPIRIREAAKSFPAIA